MTWFLFDMIISDIETNEEDSGEESLITQFLQFKDCSF